MPRPADPRVDPYAAAAAVCRRHAKSFHFAGHFLPKTDRRHAHAVYALCRRLDDAVDEAPSPQAAVAAARGFGGTLDAVYGGAALGDPVLEAARRTVATRSVPRRHFDDLAAGVEQDLTRAEYATWAELERYCYLVAGVVGLVMCRVFDLRDRSAEANAVAMGNAMQLTNICRDVGEDWGRGRLYLPGEDLRRFGVTPEGVGEMTRGGPVTGGFRRLMKFETGRARRLYAQGFAGLPALPPGGRRTAAVMAVVYGGILDAIDAADGDVFSARRRLTFAQKLRRVPRALRLARGS